MLRTRQGFARPLRDDSSTVMLHTFGLQAAAILCLGLAAMAEVQAQRLATDFTPAQREAATLKPDDKLPGNKPGDPKPFLTLGTELYMDEGRSGGMNQFVVPTKEAITAAWHDRPFVFHVPVEVPFDAGAVRIFVNASFQWEKEEAALSEIISPAGIEPPLRNEPFRSIFFMPFAHGIYRSDGTALAAGSVLWDQPRMGPPKPLHHLTDGPVPVWLDGVPPGREGGPDTRGYMLHAYSTTDRLKPFSNPNYEFNGIGSVLLRPAKPGWYVVWISLAPAFTSRWPNPALRPDDTLRARLRLDTIVTRLVPVGPQVTFPTREVVDYLFLKRGPKPAMIDDERLYVARSAEVPVTIKRDGWVFDHAKFRVDGGGRQLLQGPNQGTTVTPSTVPTATGARLSLAVAVKDQSGGRTRDIANYKGEWSVDAPAELPDFGSGWLEVRGRHITQWSDSRSGGLFPGNVPSTYLNVGAPPANLDTRKVGEFVRMAVGRHVTRDRYLGESADELRDPEGRLWIDHSKLPAWGENMAYRNLFVHSHLAPMFGSIKQRELIYQDVEAQPLLTLTCGPWLVDLYYKRKQFATPRPRAEVATGGQTRIQDEIDPFWKWFVEYSRVLRAELANAQAKLTNLGTLGSLIRDEELQARRLIRILQNDAEIESMLAGAGWRSQTLLTVRAGDAANAAGQVVEGVLRHQATPTTLTAHTFNRIRQEAVRHREQAQADRREAIADMNDAVGAYDRIIAKLGEACDRYSDRHPEVLLWRNAMRTERAMKRYAAAMATGDLAVFRQAVEDSKLGDIDPKVRLFEARLLRDSGDWAGAVYSLRTAVAVLGQPAANADARQLDAATERLRAQAEDMLKDIECAILRSALEKSQGALKEARKNFFQYLDERGFAQDGAATGTSIWWKVGLGQLGQRWREEVWPIFSTGVTGALNGILGKPGAEADLLATYETRMTTAFIGLHTILRLRMAGCTLQEIAGTGVGAAVQGGMSTARIFKVVPLKKSNGQDYTDAEKHQVGVAVREALKLPELAAIVAEDESSLRRALSAGYWSTSDVTDTWAEWVGDMTSPKNLFMNLVGMSVGSVGGVTQGVRLWSTAQAESVAAMKAIRYAESGTVVLARIVGIERAFETYRNTARGRAVVERLARLHQRYEELGMIDKAIWTAGKAVAAMALQSAASYGWKELAGEEGALMMDLIFLFAGDEDVLLRFIYAKGPSPKLLKQLLDEKHVPVLRRQVRELKTLPEQVGVWKKILADLKSGKDLSKLEADARQLVATRTPAPGIPAPPNGDPAHDVALALEGSAVGVQQNTNNGALKAAEELAQDLTPELQAKERRLSQAELLSLHLGEAARPPRPMPKPAPQHLAPAPDGPLDPMGAGGRLPAAPFAGSKWQRAEQALHEGRAEEAEKLFDELIDEVSGSIRANGDLRKDQLQLNLLAIKRNIARSRPLPRRVPHGPAPESREISESLRDRVLDAPRRTYHQEFQLPATQRKPGTSPVSFAVVDGEHYVIKQLTVEPDGPAPKVEMLMHQVEGEMVAQEVYRALGFDAPAVQLKLEYSGNQVTSATFVYRRVMGRRLDQLSAEEMYALKEQLSKLRAVSLLLGDFDRKPDNYMITPDGRIFAIDNALADPRGNFPTFRMNNQPPDGYLHMEGYWGRDHYYRRTYNYADPKTGQLTELSEKFFMSEQVLTYNDAVPTLDRINRMMSNPDELRALLRGSYAKTFGTIPTDTALPSIAAGPANIDACVDKAVETMGRRHQRLDHVMRGLNHRNGVALPDGLEPPSPELLPTLSTTSPGPSRTRAGNPKGVDISLPRTGGAAANPNAANQPASANSSQGMSTDGRPAARPAPPDASQGVKTDGRPAVPALPPPAGAASSQGMRTEPNPPPKKSSRNVPPTLFQRVTVPSVRSLPLAA